MEGITVNANEKIDKYNDPFPTRLRKLMDTRNVTQQMLANAAGVKRQTISAYADGSADPTLPKLSAIAEYFHISVDNLIGKHVCETPEKEEIHKILGLSDTAISRLSTLSGNPFGLTALAGVNSLLESKHGCEILELVARYVLADYEVGFDASSDNSDDWENKPLSTIAVRSGKSCVFPNSYICFEVEEIVKTLVLDIPGKLDKMRAERIEADKKE